jgi:hypothetical protein
VCQTGGILVQADKTSLVISAGKETLFSATDLMLPNYNFVAEQVAKIITAFCQ